MNNVHRFRVAPDAKIDLAKFPTDDDGGLDRKDAEAEFAALTKRLDDLQELMYAEGKHALLIVLQAMDCGGKDSTIRTVFGPLNAQGVRVLSFKGPNETELKHDFLWRIHQNTPRRGHIHIFNRSHYEDVLIVRVKKLIEKDRWKPRFEHINAFEKMLHDEGTVVRKFFLHISKDYQKERLERRLSKPKKHWKFDPNDLTERERWDEYQRAYADALSRCSTEHAPWWIVPAEKRWFRDLVIARVLVDTLTSLDMKFPAPTFDAATIVVK